MLSSYKPAKLYLIAVFLFLASSLSAQDKLQADGPYVFYKEGKITVKTINQTDDSTFILAEQAFYNKNKVILNCYSVETGDSFSFKLRKKFSAQKPIIPKPARIFVLSDIEGNFKGLKSILMGAGVINDKLEWVFGKGHFVMLGDVFDRGAEPTECQWLIYKLEIEAEAAGGKLHFILGNHEIMNLNGNTKYVDKKILKGTTLISDNYASLFSTDTELGRWLRTKNVIMKIGDYLFTHAGISPSLDSLNLSIDEINRIARDNIGVPKDKITGKHNLVITSSKIGPYWFRGYFNDPIDENRLDAILKKYNASKIIVGHTIVDTISSRYNGKVIAVDEEHQKNISEGFMHALLIEKDDFYIIDHRGGKKKLGVIKEGK